MHLYKTVAKLLNFTDQGMNTERMQKYTLEYTINISPKMLFHLISTPEGLNVWFAERVIAQKNVFHFYWKESVGIAAISKIKELEYVQFSWIEGESDKYFEFQIRTDSIDNLTTLLITDFANENEMEEAVMSWNYSINKLIHALGCKFSNINS